MSRCLPLALSLALVASPPATAPAAETKSVSPGTVLVRHATIWTQGPEGRLEDADLLVREGKILRVGRNLDAPSDAVVVDATGKHVTPGLIDCHSHTAIRGGVNEGSNNVTAEVRVADVIDPEDVNIYRQLAGGLTTMHLLHGSANTIGGQDAVVKLRWPADPDSMLVRGARAGIKFALGENPKRSNFQNPGAPQRFPATRMGVLESVRERFLAARDYRRTWEVYGKLSRKEQARREPPRRDLQLETIGEILDGKRVVHSHCYRQDEILALIRLADEFGIRVQTFQHVLEGYKVADEIAAHGAGASTFSDWWAFKLEAYDAIPFNGALMHERGVVVSFNSDSSELARRLNLEAAKAVKYGAVDEEEALGFVTTNAARQIGVDDRLGSLEPGKDADFVIWSSHPLSVYTVPEQTWVDGALQFDRQRDLLRREAVEKARAESIEKIRGGDAVPGPKTTPEASAPAASTSERPRAGPFSLEYVDRLASAGAPVSIVHATVHTLGLAGTIENGTVSFRGGAIVEVGPGLPPLPDAKVVDARGRHVYPGMIAALSSLGLVEISSVAGSMDVSETGAIHPQIHSALAVNPDSELIPVTRANGLTHVLTVPGGGLISGTSALVRLDGWTWEDLAATGPAAMHVRWPSFRINRSPAPGTPSEEDQKTERERNLKRIRETFEDARAYARARKERPSGARFETDPSLEAMLPVLDGRVPLIVHADEIRQIRSALEWAEQEGVRMILAGAGDAWRVADRLRERGVSVIVPSVLSLPDREDEPYDTAYSVPAKLHAAGVRFCISTSEGGFDAANGRNLPYHAGMAAAFGLPVDVALKAVTLFPAEILGLGSRLGSLEVGKSASLIVTDGDPLEIRTRVLLEYIDGRPVALVENKHERLYRRYRDRPRSLPSAR